MGINYKTETHQAKKPFPLVNPGKYKSSRPPMFKSGWEAEVFRAMDINPFVIEWGYEPFPIYYHHPFYMNYTIYWPDIYAHIQMDSGVQQKILAEIKPSKKTARFYRVVFMCSSSDSTLYINFDKKIVLF